MCKSRSIAKTPHCKNFCGCVAWTGSEEMVRHLYRNFNIERDILTYASLDTLHAEPAVLCVIGQCKECGKQICSGQTLNMANDLDALMPHLLSRIVCCDKRRYTELNNAVVQLFHEEDRGRAQDWISANRREMIPYAESI